MSVSPACIYVFLVHTWCLGRSEEANRSTGTGIMNDSEPPCGAGNWIWVVCKNSNSTPAPPLQPPLILLFWDRVSLCSPVLTWNSQQSAHFIILPTARIIRMIYQTQCGNDIIQEEWCPAMVGHAHNPGTTMTHVPWISDPWSGTTRNEEKI